MKRGENSEFRMSYVRVNTLPLISKLHFIRNLSWSNVMSWKFPLDWMFDVRTRPNRFERKTTAMVLSKTTSFFWFFLIRRIWILFEKYSSDIFIYVNGGWFYLTHARNQRLINYFDLETAIRPLGLSDHRVHFVM